MQPVNFSAPFAQLNALLSLNGAMRDGTLLKLATGLRIVTGRDDPAGLIASETLRSRLAALDAETRALDRSDTVVRVAESGLEEIDSLLVDAEALIVASANTGGLTDAERDANQLQLDSIVKSIDRIAATTSFAGEDLLDGLTSITADGESLDLERIDSATLGETEVDGEAMTLADITSGNALGLAEGDTESAAAVIGAARESISTLRGKLGAFSANTIDPARRSNQVAIENIAAAESAIRDASIAEEMVSLVRYQMLFQAGVALFGVAQSNSAATLRLIRPPSD